MSKKKPEEKAETLKGKTDHIFGGLHTNESPSTHTSIYGF